ncbi:MAG: PriCT-2 domain-containing protein [Bacteroidales bacterium]|nr:PriCT-2 domain-containing protein [Bacteroidales bacterium]
MNIKDSNISLFKSYFDLVPIRSIRFEDFSKVIIEGEYQSEVNLIRQEKNKSIRDKLKAKLPAVTISGTFKERSSANILSHSGLICLDFDLKDNPSVDNWYKVILDLRLIVNVAFAAKSVSGNGIFAVIPLAFPSQHLDQFNALKSDFKSFGLNIDSSCSDVSRLRGITSDPRAHYNPDAEPYRRIYKKPQRRNTNYISYEDCIKLIKKIISSGIDITSDYRNWYQIGASIAAEYGEEGRTLFHQISMIYPGYNQTDCDKQYNNCLKNHQGYTIATLFYYAKQFGISLINN